MRTLPDLITLRFHDETTWRKAVEDIVYNHPNVHVNAAGTLEIVIPRSLKSWVHDRFGRSSCDVLEDEKGSLGSGLSTWNGRGKGTSPNFDDPRWLDARSEEIEKRNDSLRKTIFS